MPFRKSPFWCAGLLRYSTISSICLTSQYHQCLHHQLDDAVAKPVPGAIIPVRPLIPTFQANPTLIQECSCQRRARLWLVHSRGYHPGVEIDPPPR